MLTPDEIRRYIGMVLGGRYRLNALIGQGGMGAVFSGTDSRLTRDVAVKVMSIDDAENRERHRRRFKREAERAARISHANVVTVHDFGTHSDPESGLEVDYIVMELLPGEDLAKWLPRLRANPALSVNILVQAARGVAAGHREGIVHRDVKPRNLVVSPGEWEDEVEVDVVDFGIAKPYVNVGDPTDTTGHGPISARYASPEHLQGSTTPSPQWDVFSLGVVAYEVLTGSLPFTDDDRTRLSQKLFVPVRSPRVLNPEISPAVEAVILRCLELDPSKRYPDARALTLALEQAWAAAPAPARRWEPAGEGTLQPPDTTEIDGTVLHTEPVPAAVEAHAGAAALNADAQPLDGASPSDAVSASIESDGGAAAGNGAVAGPQPPAPPDDRRQNPVQPRPERWRPGKRAWAAAAVIAAVVTLAGLSRTRSGAEVLAALAMRFSAPHEIRPGLPLIGELREGDSMTAGGRRYHVYRYRGEVGEPFTFTLDSAGFDGTLEWMHRQHGAWKTLESSGSARPAQLRVTIKDTLEYRLRVRAAQQGGRGRYTVSTRGEIPALTPGQLRRSNLTRADAAMDVGDDVWGEDWTVRAMPGSQVTVTVHAEGFLPRLWWLRSEAGLWKQVEEASNNSPRHDVQLTATVGERGEYRVRVQNRIANDAGSYTIEVSVGPRELRPGTPVTSSITRADSDAAGGLVSEQWIYRGTPGEPVMIWLQSRRRMVVEWWHLVGTQWTELKAVATNGAPTAMLVRPTGTGEYYLRVRGVTPGETGSYTLEPIVQPIIGTIAGNQSVSGTLDASDSLGDGTYGELWSLSGSPGEQVSIMMISGGLYSALSFGCWTVDGVWQKIHDDAPASPGYAQVDAAVGGTGECAVRAASAAPWGGTGPYTLLVGMQETGSAPKM